MTGEASFELGWGTGRLDESPACVSKTGVVSYTIKVHENSVCLSLPARANLAIRMQRQRTVT